MSIARLGERLVLRSFSGDKNLWLFLQSYLSAPSKIPRLATGGVS